MKMVESQTVLCNGHYEICLPLRNASSPMPNNPALALQCLNGLKKKFRNNSFRRKYTDFIKDLFVKDHASRISEELSRDDGQVWYLPHHGVIHPHKEKLRVVPDASASFAGTSLNARLLSGPELSSILFGVLVRFRQEQVAFVTDLECMFYQVKVPLHQRDLLRFLWWPQGDMQQDIVECSEESVDTVNRSFYVDDCPWLRRRFLSQQSYETWQEGVVFTWLSGSATAERFSVPSQRQRKVRMWKMLTLIMTYFQLERLLVCFGQLRLTVLDFMWLFLRSLRPNEAFCQWFPLCMTLLASQHHFFSVGR